MKIGRTRLVQVTAALVVSWGVVGYFAAVNSGAQPALVGRSHDQANNDDGKTFPGGRLVSDKEDHSAQGGIGGDRGGSVAAGGGKPDDAARVVGSGQDSKARCDALCAKYDLAEDPTSAEASALCTALRNECRLPCDSGGEPYLDIVYLWVNGSDAAYRAERAGIKAMLEGANQTVAKEAALESRVREMGMLFFSLRSVAAYVPYVRRIFLVTNGQTPTYVDASHPQIRLVDTAALIRGNPSYNSNAIQLQLHRIPTVSEPFVAMNDDFFFTVPSVVADFINPVTGRYRFRQDHYGDDWVDRRPARNPFWRSVQNANHALDDRFGRKARKVMAHVPAPVSRAVGAAVDSNWGDWVEACAAHSFRHHDDPQFELPHAWTGYYHNLTEIVGPGSDGHHDFFFVPLNGPTSTAVFNRAFFGSKARRFVCVNDDMSNPTRTMLEFVHDELLRRFPTPSPWETRIPAWNE